MRNLVPPHGKKLISLLVGDEEKKKAIELAKDMPKIKLSSLEYSDLIMLAIGAFSPLDKFMGKDDYESVLESMRLSNGILWPTPITLSVSKEKANKIGQDEYIALIDPDKEKLIAIMKVEEKYNYNKNKEALSVFGTEDISHPGVKKVFGKGDVNLSGKLKVLGEGDYPKRFPQYARPAEVRKIFLDKGWNSIAAFQTRNPLHRSHEYITKVILEVVDGLLIHPIVGKLKKGDIPAEVRMACYKVLLENYYPKDRVVLKVYPMEMRYAGPKEAVLHAIIRQNYGCSHIIIGRDHAGMGSYYGPFDAQKIFDSFSDEDLKIKPIKIGWTFYCQRCDSMASAKTCPHNDSFHKLISGTKLREMLAAGIRPPEYISRSEVSDILIEYYKKIERK